METPTSTTATPAEKTPRGRTKDALPALEHVAPAANASAQIPNHATVRGATTSQKGWVSERLGGPVDEVQDQRKSKESRCPLGEIQTIKPRPLSDNSRANTPKMSTSPRAPRLATEAHQSINPDRELPEQGHCGVGSDGGSEVEPQISVENRGRSARHKDPNQDSEPCGNPGGKSPAAHVVDHSTGQPMRESEAGPS